MCRRWSAPRKAATTGNGTPQADSRAWRFHSSTNKAGCAPRRAKRLPNSAKTSRDSTTFVVSMIFTKSTMSCCLSSLYFRALRDGPLRAFLKSASMSRSRSEVACRHRRRREVKRRHRAKGVFSLYTQSPVTQLSIGAKSAAGTKL